MELRQLTYFEAVVRCGGFTRAAENLRIAQPAVSAQVRRLERELGVELLARTSRRVSLTEAGRLFLPRARRVLDELAAARTDMADVATVLRGRVVVGATGVLGGIDLPSLMAGFSRRYPGVSLVLRSGLTSALLADLGAGDLDLVLGPVHDDLPASLVAEPLAEDRLVLITAPGRWPRRDTVALADLDGEPFVCLPDGAGLRAVVAGLADRLGCAFPVHFEAPAPDSVRGMVAAGLGVALMAASAVEGPGPPVDVHAITPAVAHPPFGILRRADVPPGPAADAFHRHVLQTLTAG